MYWIPDWHDIPGINIMKTVLIIDDEKDLCRLLTIALKREKFGVDCAYSLAEARSKLLEHPSIVLLDNNLPDGSGLDFFKEHLDAFHKSCVIMISADVKPETKKDALREGISIFLQKPFEVGAIKDAIRSIPERLPDPNHSFSRLSL